MNLENRATKLYLKELAPLEALKLFHDYRIPSPYKEVLIACCIERLDAYSAIDFLEDEYDIHIGYFTYIRRLKTALTMFRKSHIK